MTLPLLALCAFAAMACDGGPTPTLAAAQDTSLVISADPALRSQVAALLPGLADRAGLELHDPVRVEWRTRAELESYLRVKVDEELPEEEATRIVRSYALLGLVPTGLDLRAVLLDLYLEQVAGFYDPDSTALWVLDDQPAEAVETVLLHELVHAVQDQAAPLDSITGKELGSDRRTAAQAAIEGHATLVMLEAMFEEMSGQPLDLSELPDIAATLGPTLEAARSQYPALASVPRIFQESLLFPYIVGAGFVLELWTAVEGRPAPFGDRLPESTEQILHPERFLGANPDPPIALTLTGDEPIEYEEQMGELGLRVFAQEQLDDSTGVLADGWGGDAFALQSGGVGEGITWVVVWDSAAARDRFVAAVGRSDWSRATGARIEPLVVEGLPASVMSVGSRRTVRVTVGGVTPP